MRMLRREPLGQGPTVLVYQEGSDEVWLVNDRVDDVAVMVDEMNKMLETLNRRERPLPRRWRVLRRLVRPVCRRVHVC